MSFGHRVVSNFTLSPRLLCLLSEFLLVKLGPGTPTVLDNPLTLRTLKKVQFDWTRQKMDVPRLKGTFGAALYGRTTISLALRVRDRSLPFLFPPHFRSGVRLVRGK